MDSLGWHPSTSHRNPAQIGKLRPTFPPASEFESDTAGAGAGAAAAAADR